MKLELSDKFVLSATSMGRRQLDIFDLHPQSDGLMLRVNAGGTKTWLIRYRTVDGRQRRFVLGRYPSLSLRDARSKARDVRGRARDGEDPAGDQQRQRSEARAEPIKTVEELQAVYFTACETGEWKPRGRKKRASTLAEERGLWKRHLKAGVGELRVEDVTPAAIKKVLRALVAKGHGTTANRVRSLLRQIFNFAISEGRIERNPIDKVAALGTETARARVLSDPELKTLWKAMRDPSELRKPAPDGEDGEKVYVGEPVSIALRLLLLTLARRAEVAGMVRSELDLEQSIWTIPGERTKNGRPLLLPLSTKARDLIKEAIGIADDGHEKPSALVFPSPRDRSKAITPAALSHAVRDLRLSLGLTDTRPHDFRRTAASIMVSERLSITPFIVGRILNHTTETGGAAAVTHRHYAVHDYVREKRIALESWADLLVSIVNKRERASNVTQLAGGAA